MKGEEADKTKARVERAVLKLMAYFAVFGLPQSEVEINSLAEVKTSHLAIKEALRALVEAKRLELDDDGYYRLPGYIYHARPVMERRQAKLLRRAKRWSRAFKLLPFVKAVVVVSSVGMGNVRADSDIDLLIVTKPNRIYLTKGILMNVLKWLGQLKNEQHKAGRFSLGMFLTTAGINWQRDIMTTNDPHLVYWLMCAKPVYGSAIWYDLLKSSPYIQEHVPNYIWPKSEIRVYSGGLERLDALDNKGYRMHLRHTASQPKMHTDAAFTRVRPDIINLHAYDKSGKISRQYQRICKNLLTE